MWCEVLVANVNGRVLLENEWCLVFHGSISHILLEHILNCVYRIKSFIERRWWQASQHNWLPHEESPVDFFVEWDKCYFIKVIIITYTSYGLRIGGSSQLHTIPWMQSITSVWFSLTSILEIIVLIHGKCGDSIAPKWGNLALRVYDHYVSCVNP